jgi:hypothetical protein
MSPPPLLKESQKCLTAPAPVVLFPEYSTIVMVSSFCLWRWVRILLSILQHSFQFLLHKIGRVWTNELHFGSLHTTDSSRVSGGRIFKGFVDLKTRFLDSAHSANMFEGFGKARIF